jgi:hypothetical protein
MRCPEILDQLSMYLDEVLEADAAAQIRRHLDACPGCRLEYDRLSRLQMNLRALERAAAPDYFPDLMRIRIHAAEKRSWMVSLRSAWEYRWSRIRSMEATWYLTRVMGLVFTSVCFFSIYAVLNQFMVDLPEPPPYDRGSMSQAARPQVLRDVLKNLGMAPAEAQKKPIRATNPDINGLYLLNLGQSAVRTTQDDTVSVVAMVDRMGGATIENVLEYPADQLLLAEFTSMIRSVRCRPARLNGRAVDSRVVLTFSKISVYE